MTTPPRRTYYVVGGETSGHRGPDYDRVVKSLTDRDLEDEIAAGRGEDGYQQALLAERERRQK